MTFTIRTYSADPQFPATDQHPQATRYRFGETVVDAIGDLTEAEFEAWRLDHAKDAAGHEIASLAEARREAITATGAGKRDAYLLKYELVLKAGTGDATAINLLTAEASARGISYEQLSTLIGAKRQAWETAAMAIETVEAATKTAAATAADRDAVAAAVATARQLFAEIGG